MTQIISTSGTNIHLQLLNNNRWCMTKSFEKYETCYVYIYIYIALRRKNRFEHGTCICFYCSTWKTNERNYLDCSAPLEEIRTVTVCIICEWVRFKKQNKKETCAHIENWMESCIKSILISRIVSTMVTVNVGLVTAVWSNALLK